MRIGFMAPADFALGNPGNGVVVQARSQATALQHRGHEVVFLNPWQHQSFDNLDVVQIFLGGFGAYGVQNFFGPENETLLVMAPIIDSNQPNWAYRAAVAIGSTFGKIRTIPGVLAQQARASDVVVCRSEFERRRVIAGLGVRRDRTVIVLNGGDAPNVAPETAQAVQQRYDLPDKFILHVSAYTQDRKNVLRLAAAAEELKLPLVIAGHEEPNAVARELAERARDNRNLRLLGFVDRATRDALYALCHVFCLPSYHEGTGLAALEAGATGARVVITRHGGPRDYFGEFASYVNPFDVREIRDAIAEEWPRARNTALAERIRTRLTWDASAAALESAYELGLERRRTSRAAYKRA